MQTEISNLQRLDFKEERGDERGRLSSAQAPSRFHTEVKDGDGSATSTRVCRLRDISDVPQVGLT